MASMGSVPTRWCGIAASWSGVGAAVVMGMSR